MRAGLGIVAVILCASNLMAQETPPYKTSDNPFQEDLAFALGQPVVLQVEVAGVRFAAIDITPRGDVLAGTPTSCDVAVTGSNLREGKVEVSTVLLLEDGEGKAIERVQLESFKAKSGRDFEAVSRVTIQADSLLAASKVYVYVEVSF